MLPVQSIKPVSLPYNFDLLITVLGRFAHPARYQIKDNQLWHVTAGALVAYENGGDAIHFHSNGRADIAPVIEASRRIFASDIDLTEFYEFAKQNAVLWRVVEPLYGLPVFCTETVYEALITLIIEQHISWKNALRSQQTLLHLIDNQFTSGDVTVYDFPQPEQLTIIEPETLKPLKITNKRIDLIITVSQDVVAGKLDLEGLRDVPVEQAYERLMQIKGIGHWTAANVISRAFGVVPYISHNDVALQAAVQLYFYDDVGKKSAQNVIDTFQRYGKFGGLASHFTIFRWVLDRYPPVPAD